jgi:thymidylate kinase
MKRLDLLGVPGVGKTTLYNLLGENREHSNDYFIFDEAYRSVILKELPFFYRYLDEFIGSLKSSRYSNRLFNAFVRPFERAIVTEKQKIEEENLEQAIEEMQRKYPGFLSMRLSGIGKPLLQGTPDYPSDYLKYKKKTYHQINQYDILEKSIGKETIVVFDNSFAHKVLSIVDYSKEIDENIINQYTRTMPPPAGLVIFQASPMVIVARIRSRAQNGLINNWHREIVDNKVLDEWVEKACEITSIARRYFLKQNYPLLDINTELPPLVNVRKIQTFIQEL